MTYTFTFVFRFMASHRSEYSTGATDDTDAHDKIQTVAENATWFNEFTPGIEGSDKRIADVQLRLFHSLALCCAIVGEFAMYIAGKLVSRHDSITMPSLTTIKRCPRIFPPCYNYKALLLFL